jgi:beta-galactosidase
VMVHEYGASTLQFTPDQIASYDRLLAWSSFGRGAIGFYAWCWTDAEPEAHRRAPYVRMPHELQFGMTEHTGEPRPRLAVATELARTLRDLPLDELAGDGPVEQAGIVVPHEYVSAYDVPAYGLDDAPSGPYLPAERAWDPERDVKPLVRGWLNAFVLAARAGIQAGFPRERLDDGWPDLPLVLLPAPLTTTTSSLLHVRTSFWGGAAAFHEAGGTAYLSLSSESAVPDLAGLAGVRMAGRAPVRPTAELEVVTAFGGLAAGERITIPAGHADLHLRGARLDVVDATVLAVDADGLPALTVAERGAGQTFVCAYPLELLLAAEPDAHADDSTWRIYDAVRRAAGLDAPLGIEHPDLTLGELGGPGGRLVTVSNHSGVPVTVRLTEQTVRCSPGGDSTYADGLLTVAPHGTAVLAQGSSLPSTE